MSSATDPSKALSNALTNFDPTSPDVALKNAWKYSNPTNYATSEASQAAKDKLNPPTPPVPTPILMPLPDQLAVDNANRRKAAIAAAAGSGRASTILSDNKLG